MIKSALQSSLTNDVRYRSMSAGNVPSSEYLITSVVLDQNEPSVIFSNLAQYAGVYQHLQIRYVARSSYAGTAEAVFMRMNGVTTASYSRHRLSGNGSTVSSAGESSAQTSITGIGALAGATASSGIFASGVIDLLDAFSDSKNTTARCLSGQSGGSSSVTLSSGAFLSTASLTSVTLFSETAANFVANSRFSLYGVTA